RPAGRRAAPLGTRRHRRAPAAGAARRRPAHRPHRAHGAPGRPGAAADPPRVRSARLPGRPCRPGRLTAAHPHRGVAAAVPRGADRGRPPVRTAPEAGGEGAPAALPAHRARYRHQAGRLAVRRAVAGLPVAVTSMVALSFLIPLALLVREQARDQATIVAEQRASALSPVLALTTRRSDVEQALGEIGSPGRLAVRLPDGDVVGTPHAPRSALDRAVEDRQTLALDTEEGWSYLQPVVLRGDRVAVVESHVPAADLRRGVAASWGVMALLALGLVGGSVLVADRLGARVVRSSRSLKRASLALGSGDLDVRVEPDGPPELQEAGAAFNTMADRVVDLLAVERELVADLSHRLRTPLTALCLE